MASTNNGNKCGADPQGSSFGKIENVMTNGFTKNGSQSCSATKRQTGHGHKQSPAQKQN